MTSDLHGEPGDLPKRPSDLSFREHSILYLTEFEEFCEKYKLVSRYEHGLVRQHLSEVSLLVTAVMFTGRYLSYGECSKDFVTGEISAPSIDFIRFCNSVEMYSW